MGKETSVDCFVGRAEAPDMLSGFEVVSSGGCQRMGMRHGSWVRAGTELKPWQPEVGESLEEAPSSRAPSHSTLPENPTLSRRLS